MAFYADIQEIIWLSNIKYIIKWQCGTNEDDKPTNIYENNVVYVS